MSGIIFNGVEMKKGEEQKAYINRVLKEMDLSDDDITPQESTDDDTETDSDSELSHTFTYYYKCMLGTYDCSMEEHDDAIRWFNNKYGTRERGSNGSKGHYFTHGDTPYDLFKLPKLKSLYDRNIKAVHIYNVKIHIDFIKCDLDENTEANKELKSIREETNRINNFRSQRDNDRFIEIKKCHHFMKLLNIPDIEIKRDYNHSKSTNKHTFKIGDVVFYNSREELKYIVYWQIIKITNRKIKIKPLRPIKTIKHIQDDSNKRAYLYKYKKDDFLNCIKSVYNNKDSHNTVYIIDDYIYRIFNDE
jgi:hypothetical protein